MRVSECEFERSKKNRGGVGGGNNMIEDPGFLVRIENPFRTICVGNNFSFKSTHPFKLYFFGVNSQFLSSSFMRSVSVRRTPEFLLKFKYI